MSRLVLAVGVLLTLGLLLSLQSPVPGLHPAVPVPVREGELWEMNQSR